VRYRIKLVREYEFEIDIDATSRSDAIGKIMRTALEFDQNDHKVTKIVSITETPKDVHHPLN
jgi:hypothetical protein